MNGKWQLILFQKLKERSRQMKEIIKGAIFGIIMVAISIGVFHLMKFSLNNEWVKNHVALIGLFTLWFFCFGMYLLTNFPFGRR